MYQSTNEVTLQCACVSPHSNSVSGSKSGQGFISQLSLTNNTTNFIVP